jgi:hypothetical protein
MEERIEIDFKELELANELNCGAIVIKLYKVPVKYKFNRNITAENEQGKIIWQVEDMCPLFDAPFTSIRLFNNEKVIAYNWIGVEYYIDIQTGKTELVNKNARPW